MGLSVAAGDVVQQRFGGRIYSRFEIVPVAIVQRNTVTGVDGGGGRAAVIFLFLAGRIRADKYQPVVIAVGEWQFGQVAIWF